MKKPNSQSNNKQNKKIQMFFVFLGISTLLWTISKLSKEYTHTIKANAKYINLTNDKELQSNPIKEIELVIRTSGFNHLGFGVLKKDLKIDLTKLQKKGTQYFYLTNNNLSSLQSQLKSDEVLLRVYPDTLFFDFGELISKRIKVIPNLNLSYKSGFGIVGNIEVKPKTILINGTVDQIKKINLIKTVLFEKKNIITSFNKEIRLDIPKEYHKIHFSTRKVTINAVVEKFTEAKITVPFELINVPKNYNVSTFKNTIEVIYKVSLDNYDKIRTTDFKVVCDFNTVKKSELSYLIPTIIKKPNLVSNIRMYPNKIEFLIKK